MAGLPEAPSAASVDARDVPLPCANGNASPPWFALRVRSRCEKAVAEILRGKGYEEFLPLYRSRNCWSDRLKEVDLPLFPGYVFCRFDPLQRLPILTTPGLVSIVGFKLPQPVDEAELEAVRAVMKSGLPASPWPYLKTGQWIRIDCGALDGLEGIVVRVKNRYRVVVSVTLLERSVAVEIDRDCICPVSRRCGVPYRHDAQNQNGQLSAVR